MRDTRTRDAIATLRAALDADAVTAVWDAAVEAPAWQGTPVWLHGDLQSGNLLAAQGRLSAVIDFGVGSGRSGMRCDGRVDVPFCGNSRRIPGSATGR